MNKTLGPNNMLLFDYSTEASGQPDAPAPHLSGDVTSAMKSGKSQSNINILEGASDDATLTKVVDRRWYERNKHIYPASMWQDFDPEKDYGKEIRRDTGGNAFFYS
jgi:protein FAM50